MKAVKISNREMEVLNLISLAFSTSEIAQELYISSETAKTHRKNLLLKINAKNSAGLVRKAFELGFLKINNPVRLELAS
jgi:DNA-binding CsgD family transcriptional regulator